VGKILIWLLIIFAALFALRLLNAAKAKSRNRPPAKETGGQAHPMVRCNRCGVFLPRAEARADGDNYRCADAKCQNRRPA
jgi:hypothetical protein